MITYLLKPGELVLKGGNRREFERVLKRNLDLRLRPLGCRTEVLPGRIYVRCPEDEAAIEKTEKALDAVLGITGWAKTRPCPKTAAGVIAGCAEEARSLRERGIQTFKIEARRTDKSFPLDSYRLRCEAGTAAQAAAPGLQVDVKNPQAVIQVEVRERAYVYSLCHRGRRGLPVGTAGRGMLLLSGGIDSPVAGYLMAGRGMRLEAVHFHTYPYTSPEAQEKAVRLAKILAASTLGIKLHLVAFTEVQKRIREAAPEAWATVLLRMAMMAGAEALARGRCKCLITGESLSQVASQTVENIACTQSRLTLPVLRPLIGLDKEAIVQIARDIGTYETSILPYEDCCVLFSPVHPVLRGSVEEARRLYDNLDTKTLIEEALRSAEVTDALA